MGRCGMCVALISCRCRKYGIYSQYMRSYPSVVRARPRVSVEHRVIIILPLSEAWNSIILSLSEVGNHMV